MNSRIYVLRVSTKEAALIVEALKAFGDEPKMQALAEKLLAQFSKQIRGGK